MSPEGDVRRDKTSVTFSRLVVVDRALLGVWLRTQIPADELQAKISHKTALDVLTKVMCSVIKRL